MSESQAVADLVASQEWQQLVSQVVTAEGARNGAQNPTWVAAGAPDMVVSTPVSYTYLASGSPTISYAVVGGSLSAGVYTGGGLPAGVSLTAATGVLAGTPTTATTYNYTVTASNTNGTISTAETVVVTSSAPSAPDPATFLSLAHPGGGSWTPALFDHFTGTTIDQTKWNLNWYGTPTQVTKGANGAEIAVMDPAMLSVANSMLTINIQQGGPFTANDGSGWVRSWRGGMITTLAKHQFTKGVVAARVWLPGPAGGPIPNWPAIWTDLATGSWPVGGEFDIMEGLSGSAACTVHNGPSANTDTQGSASTHPAGIFTGWHIYAYNWQTNLLDFYYDGVIVKHLTSLNGGASIPTSVNHFMILANTCSNNGNFGGVPTDGAAIQCDWFGHWT